MMSRPSTTSGFRLEALTNAGKQKAGRKFAKTSRPLRKASRPASGRLSRAVPAHFGPPTAPSRTASDRRACSSVSSFNGVPWASKDAPPTSPSSNRRSGARTSTRRRTSATTSGPIPSPGNNSKVCFTSALHSCSDKFVLWHLVATTTQPSNTVACGRRPGQVDLGKLSHPRVEGPTCRVRVVWVCSGYQSCP